MKIKLIYFFFLAANMTFAQFSSLWTKIDAIQSPFIYSVYFDENYIFVGSDSLYISTDRGITWNSVLPKSDEVVAIQAIVSKGNYLYAGTSGSGVYRSPDNGTTWQPYDSGLKSWAKIIKCFLISGDRLYLGSDGGGVYYNELNSDNWTEYNENLPSLYAWTVNSMCHSGNNLILSSGQSGFYYVRADGSSGWEEKTIDGSVQYITPTDFLSNGDTVFAGVSKTLYRSIDNGLTWDSVGIRAIPIKIVSFARDNNRIYTGLSRAYDFYTWYSDDGGNNWNIDSHELTALNKIYIYDNRIWAATYEGLWYKSLNPSSGEPPVKENKFSLEQNFPNPFNPSTSIKFSIPEQSHVQIKISDILGKEIYILLDEEKEAGSYTVRYDASLLSSGIYFYSLLVPGKYSKILKMIVLK